jgi:hypothetical protein
MIENYKNKLTENYKKAKEVLGRASKFKILPIKA